MTACDTRSIADWLTDGARSAAEPQEVLAELCDRLVRCGIPLYRVAVFVRTLHPDIMGRRFLWREGSGVSISAAPFATLSSDDFRLSPVARIYRDGAILRRRLADPACPDDFPLIAELRGEGVTDYIAIPLFFTWGEIHAATWTTRAPGGFTDDQAAALQALAPPFTRVAEVRALRRTAVNFLNTYVGHNAGERILAGRIRRGHTERLDAAIWLSDMRGFTARADRLAPQTLIDLLNRYFDCQVPAILGHGGEVLKFMGDGLLAIFPVTAGSEASAVCRAALTAALEARTAVAALERSAETASEDGVRFGLALHRGEVLYGNIGGGNRLDFTCIGPAVNLAARLEKLTGKLGRTVLASAAFARHCPEAFAPVGDFALAGFAAPQTAFGLIDEAS
ncbi:MAG TPA: adenylate/guanylate cyclase domain-containing protein [Stellaceae bacterium]|nr:adenylate/guanylate cyclase domain-containing protein [Stellaceae bacterium]